MKLVLLIAIMAFIASCDRRDDVIIDKSPFIEVLVPTPPDGGVGVVNRSKKFAQQNGMRFQYSFQHFSDGEYSVRLLRRDFNIATDNVLRDRKTIVNAYSRSEPTEAQRQLASEYLCTVMLHRCGSADVTSIARPQ